VIYEVYPRSFADSDGDGEGDLVGLLDRLPYLADLGVDALWIAPWYPSPLADGGYDTSNEHPWFRAALRAGADSADRDLYIFRDGRGPDGNEPPRTTGSARRREVLAAGGVSPPSPSPDPLTGTATSTCCGRR
jgi:alpha-glucosidase